MWRSFGVVERYIGNHHCYAVADKLIFSNRSNERLLYPSMSSPPAHFKKTRSIHNTPTVWKPG
jgi:hypothetical protein